jgi:4-amino-4-deoxy-L-arabinose transferase-like glycosyltransferase
LPGVSNSRSKRIDKHKAATQRERQLTPGEIKVGRGLEVAILVTIMLGAAVLRLANRDASPPGLNQDEAVNGWNAWCLLKTGVDQTGQSWPLFYFRGLGSNYTPLNFYLLMPIQAVGGMNIWTTRATASLGGILTVFLIWFVGKRLLGPVAGLTAAALLALNPWHLLASRWGIEANICPLLAIVPLAMLLAARLPAATSPKRPSIVLAVLGGILTGLCLYGYPAVFIFLPLFLIAIIALNWRQWLDCLRDRRGLAAALAWAVTAAAVFAPLAWQHAFHGSEIRKRTVGTWIWDFHPSTANELSFGDKVGAVVGRYFQHFGPDFLFLRGDHSSIESPPGMGMFYWYMLPLFLLGIVWCVKNFRASAAAKVIAAWVALYPVGDSLGWSVGDDQQLCLHSLRSSPGICGLVLLAAAGATWAGGWLWSRSRSWFWGATLAMALAVVLMNVRYLSQFFAEYNRRPFIYHRYHADLVAASRWLKPRLDQYDAVFCTTDALAEPIKYLQQMGADLPVFVPDGSIKQPYIIMLHELDYNPQRWLKEAPEMSDPNGAMYTVCFRFGKICFLYPAKQIEIRNSQPHMAPTSAAFINELRGNGKPDRVLFILRPGEEKFIEGLEGLGPPLEVIKRPDGIAALVLIEATL